MDPGTGNEHDRALLMATSARFQWPSPRGFVSAYAQNLMAADTLTLQASCRVYPDPVTSSLTASAVDMWILLTHTTGNLVLAVSVMTGMPRPDS